MKIDSHNHFWKYDPKGYSWINDAMHVIQADFLPADLESEAQKVGIDGTIVVQARQTLEESRWLLELADKHRFVQGVVAWAPLTRPEIRTYLGELAKNPRLKGIRHIVQDEPDDRFLLRDDFNNGILALAEYKLVYDILIYERHLPHAIEFVDRHPQQIFVLDHLAKPRVKDHVVEPWRTNIQQLAERENVYCKVSGLVTEANWLKWTEDQLAVYLGTVFDAFGPRRLMFGSDWPVCLLATSYGKWYEVVSRFCAKLSPAEQARIFGETASEAYQLDS
jgi:L-fuconolactonase